MLSTIEIKRFRCYLSKSEQLSVYINKYKWLIRLVNNSLCVFVEYRLSKMPELILMGVRNEKQNRADKIGRNKLSIKVFFFSIS